jgi:hypothetical protein
MQHLGLDSSRVETFTADGTSVELGQRLAGCGADVALIMFTLSAVVPEGMLGMMRNAAASLRPGGLLCIRDHALYDMVSDGGEDATGSGSRSFAYTQLPYCCCAACASAGVFCTSPLPPAQTVHRQQQVLDAGRSRFASSSKLLNDTGFGCVLLCLQVQLRIPADQCKGRHLYRRGDGTLAYFYTTQELAGLASAAGLEVLECDYVCVVNKNRKTGQALRRAFVHGVFRKPGVVPPL